MSRDVLLKLGVYGDGGVGKTSLVNAFFGKEVPNEYSPTFNSKINRVPVYPSLLIIGTDTTKAAEIHLDIGNTFGGDLDFSFIDETNSVVEIATDNVTTVDGRQVATIRLRSVAPFVLDMQKVLETLLPREELTISGNVTSGSASEIDVSLIWQEDS